TDFSDHEFCQFFLSQPIHADRRRPENVQVHYAPKDLNFLPDSSGYATNSRSGVVTAVKNQGKCGSGWAFAAVAAIEGAHGLSALEKPGVKLESLSEQNLIDCSIVQGKDGCEMGVVTNAYEYVIANQGI